MTGVVNMTIRLKGKTYLRTAEACSIAGISKNTFLRWIKLGTLADVEQRDRRGWRLFTHGDVERLKTEVNRMQGGIKTPR